ncbi:unnamed protein product [Bathycoccus prasinos]
MMTRDGNGGKGDQEVPTSTKNTKSSSEDGGSNDNEGQGFWNEGGRGFGGTMTKKRPRADETTRNAADTTTRRREEEEANEMVVVVPDSNNAHAKKCPYHHHRTTTRPRTNARRGSDDMGSAENNNNNSDEYRRLQEEILQLRKSNEELKKRLRTSTSSANANQTALSNNLLRKLAPLKELAMDSLEEGVTIADFTHPLQPLVFANQGFTEITGYTVDETVGKNCRFLQGPETEPEVVRKIKYAVMNGLSITCQLKNYKKNGEMFINNLSLKPIRNENSVVTHYVGIQSDVTKIVDSQNAEIEALKRVAIANAATESKSKFLAHMSHEIRTPLNGLIAVGQLLEDTKLDRVQRDLVTTMQSSGETLQALISDILDFSRVEAEKLSLAKEPFNPEAVIANVLEIVGIHAGRLKLNVGYHVDEGVPKTVLGDAMRVQQVLLNSINNAIKFTEKGDIMVRLYIGMAPKTKKMQRVNSSLAMNDDWITPLSKLAHMCPHFSPKDGEQPQEKAGSGEGEAEEKAQCPFHNQHSTEQKLQQQQNDIKRSHELSEATGKGAATTHSGTVGSGNQSGGSENNDKPVYLHFYVKDTGIGLSANMIREVFNSFRQVDDGTTRKFDGSGLGLAISRKLCEAMGGTIWAESEGLGKGSTFHFCVKCQVANENDMTDKRESIDNTSNLVTTLSSPVGLTVQKLGNFSAMKHHAESWIPQKVNMSIGDENGRRSTVLVYDESHMICKTIESSLQQWCIEVEVVTSAQSLFEKLRKDVAAHPEDEKNRKYGCVIAQRSPKFERELLAFAQKQKLVRLRRNVRRGLVPSPEVQMVVPPKKKPKEHTPVEVHKILPAMLLLTWPAAAKVLGGGIAGTLARLHEKNEEVDQEALDVETEVEKAVSEAERKRVVKLCEAILAQSNFEAVTKPVRYGNLQQAIYRVMAREKVEGEDECSKRGKISNKSAAHLIKEKAPESAGPPPKLRILLAEDHLINMKVAKAVLGKCGCDDVVWAKDGVVALELIEKEEQGVDAFDIILMDLHMPRCGGLECVRKIREQYPDSKIPIVAVTADAMTESRDNCMRDGFTGWLTKPFRIEQIKSLVDDIVTRKQTLEGKQRATSPSAC